MEVHAIGPHYLAHGDCIEVMRLLPDNSIDACVSDPPYGLGFMGKHWDGEVPGVDFARELLRVLKPGAHACLFGGTRTYHRLAVALEDEGFEIRDCLSWLYGTGFPKSLDISKAIDKEAGAIREVVGRATGRAATPKHDIRGGRYADGTSRTIDLSDITAPATDAARQWEGWGTALKPAWEPIILARKPLIGTVAANVQAHGTGGLNIDACRIEGAPDVPGSSGYKGAESNVLGKGWNATASRRAAAYIANPPSGRWPANVVLDEANEHVLCLREDIPAEVADVIKGFFHGYNRLPAMWRQYSDLSEQGESHEVLRASVPSEMAFSQRQGCASSHEGENAHADVTGKNEGKETSLGKEGAVKHELERGSIHVSRVRDDQPGDTTPRSSRQVQADDWGKHAARNTGAPPCDGDESRAPSAAVGSSPSSKRSEVGQQDRESGDPRQRDAQTRALRNNAGAEGHQTRKRTLAVLACDVPSPWHVYFRRAGVARSPDCAAAMLDEQSGTLKSGSRKPGSYRGMGYQGAGAWHMPDVEGNTGGASRFFYTAKPSRAERDLGCDHLPARTGGEATDREDGAPGATNPRSGAGRTGGARNIHPTVKPAALIRWLLQLVTPPGGCVLDPFVGSGTVYVAAKGLDLSVAGIEREAEYITIALARGLASV